MNKKIGLGGLVATAIGTTVGAGVVTLIGRAVSMTGGSVWLAYLVAIFWGMLTVAPFAIVGSALTVKGGNYSVILYLLGEKIAGIYVCSSILMAFNWATFGVGLSDYLTEYLPQIDKRFIAIACILCFYCINLLGVNLFAKIQGIMTILLVAMLLFFGLSGLPRLNMEIFNFSSASFMSGGLNGFFEAVGILLYSTVAYQIMLNFSGQARNSKKNIPKSMLICALAITVIYELVTVTATGTVPLEEAAQMTLMGAASTMWPKILVHLFVLFGPVMALATTLNGNMASFSVSIRTAANDGWFPDFIAKTNRFDSPYVVYTIGAVIAIIPIILGIDFSTIVKDMVIIFNITSLFIFCSAFNLPKKMPDAWEKSSLHMPKTVFYIVMSVVFVAIIGALWLQFRSVDMKIIIMTIVAYCVIIGYSMYRLKRGYVKIDKSQLIIEQASEE